jgi:glycosyltransferase involved in cell wall biosynthesis
MIIGIYNDSSVFGGHELVTIRMANTLSEKHQVVFFYFQEEISRKLCQSVKALRLTESAPSFLCGVRSYSPSIINELSAKFAEQKINILIVAQGAIEHGLRGLWAGKQQGIPVISYIPLCFPMKRTGGRFGAIRDVINLYFYRSFDGFITISDEQKGYLKKYAPSKEVHIVNNPFSFFSQKPQRRSRFGMNIGVIGRVEFRHKGQDKLPGLAKRLIKKDLNFKFFICGDGPDLGRLKTMVDKSRMSKYFEFLGWVENNEDFYDRIDLVLCMSNYEGVPLVLLESIDKGVPFFGPNMGIFKEYLPEPFLFHDDEDLVEKLVSQQPDDTYEKLVGLLEGMRQKTYLKHAESNFRKEIFACVEHIAPS